MFGELSVEPLREVERLQIAVAKEAGKMLGADVEWEESGLRVRTAG